MESFFVFLIVGLVLFTIFKMFTTSSYKATEDYFEQAGVKVVFSTGKVTIKGKTYDANDIQGITSRVASRFGTEVSIKVDDFHKPIYRIGILGIGNAGEKFIQRFSTALRKAGGASFY